VTAGRKEHKTTDRKWEGKLCSGKKLSLIRDFGREYSDKVKKSTKKKEWHRAEARGVSKKGLSRRRDGKTEVHPARGANWGNNNKEIEAKKTCRQN